MNFCCVRFLRFGKKKILIQIKILKAISCFFLCFLTPSMKTLLVKNRRKSVQLSRVFHQKHLKMRNEVDWMIENLYGVLGQQKGKHWNYTRGGACRIIELQGGDYIEIIIKTQQCELLDFQRLRLISLNLFSIICFCCPIHVDCLCKQKNFQLS